MIHRNQCIEYCERADVDINQLLIQMSYHMIQQGICELLYAYENEPSYNLYVKIFSHSRDEDIQREVHQYAFSHAFVTLTIVVGNTFCRSGCTSASPSLTLLSRKGALVA